MKAKSFSHMRCSIAQSLEQVGHWWSILIIRDAMMGARRFGQFQRSLGIAKHTLSMRLSGLVEHGILDRTPSADGSHHDEYELTAKGLDLAPVLMSLSQWGDKWSEHEQGRTFAFTDRQTGGEISRIRARRDDGSAIPFDEIALKPFAARSER